MHIPDLHPLAAKVDGIPPVEQERTSSAAAVTVPQTGLQDSPAFGGWGSLPWGGLPGFMTDVQSNTSPCLVGPAESTWPKAGDKRSAWHARCQDHPKSKEEGLQGQADEEPRTQVTTLRPWDPPAIEGGGRLPRNVPPER